MSSSSAPGTLETVRSFVNTIEPEDGVDLMQADGSLAEWCADEGLPNPGPEELRTLRSLREALRSVFEAHAGNGVEAEAWRLLEPFIPIASYKMGAEAGATLRLQPQGSGLEQTVGRLFACVYESMRERTWYRLKACRKESCRWAFYDRSKNGSGAWCSMRVCGNRAKAQRRRRRQKAAL